jgi:hypothetical protein
MGVYRLSQETKTHFKENGHWEIFLELRQKYLDEKMSPRGARERAAEEVSAMIANSGAPNPKNADNAADKINTDNQPAPLNYNSPAVIKPIDVSEEDAERLKALALKKASYNESLEWAMNHLEIPVEIEDAISPISWSLLKQMRRNPAFRTDMFTKVALRKSSKEDEEDGRESYDGEAQVKVLMKLKDISDKALREAAII